MKFYSTPRDETFYGGPGVDTVYFSGKGQDYTVTVYSKSEQDVRDYGNYINDGHDKLFSIERLNFSDGTLAFDTDGAAGQGYRIYQAAFDRKPDASGLGYWVRTLDNGANLVDVGADFVNSSEFRKMYGPNLSNSEFVQELYYNVLGRTGEQSGVNYWADQLSYGYTRGWVLASFSESAENVAGVAPAISDGIWYT